MERDYIVNAASVYSAAGTAVYMLQLVTPSTTPIDIIDITVGCDTTSTDTLKVELCTWTGAGQGATAFTPIAWNGDASLVAANTTASVGPFTSAPSSVTVVKTWLFPTPTSTFELELPLGREYTVPKSTYCGLRFTTTSTFLHGYASVTFEE
jgi:hypothetical protein